MQIQRIQPLYHDFDTGLLEEHASLEAANVRIILPSNWEPRFPLSDEPVLLVQLLSAIGAWFL